MEFDFEYVSARSNVDLSTSLDPLVKKWFFSRFKDFSLTQRYGVMSIFERKSILISAPTGGTKTLTAFLSILNYLEKVYGYSKRSQILNQFQLNEAVFLNPDDPIHLNLTLDIAQHLYGINKNESILYNMGTFSIFVKTNLV